MGKTLPLAVTMGEPAGIGGEVILASWLRLRETGPSFFAIDNPRRLESLADMLGLDIRIQPISDASEAQDCFARALPVLPVDLPFDVTPGQPDSRNGSAVISAIEKAVELSQSGKAAAVVTAPINKAVLYDAGFRYPGHTEFLTDLAGVDTPVMMLANSELRVVPVSIHKSLRDAVEGLTQEAILRKARITDRTLRQDFGLPSPRLAIAGLNPHAGENGAMGTEEQTIVGPVVDILRSEGINAIGPMPPDTMFHAAARNGYDAAICMYHDQALIPLKTIDFDGGVNVTLGLPFIRTSPDHGTAFDIAGKGIARPDSMIAAIAMAADIVARRDTIRS
jgi:4-hydroxythreonine-4-phosphate dehydrogenase